MLKIEFEMSDLSIQQSRFEFVAISLEFDGSKEMVVSYYKPINSLFFNVAKQTISSKISIKYYNGTSFVPVTWLKDLTFGLSCAGHTSWDRNQLTETKTGGVYQYKVTITETDGSPLIAPITCSFKGINLVFSDDYDLVEEYPSILQHLPDGQETFIRFHSASRDDILTDLKNSGIVINGQDKKKQLDQWDLLDIDEVKEASKFSTLSKIFSWLSDAEGDKFDQLSSKYQAEAGESLTPLISIDDDDDGISDSSEEVQPNTVFVGRL